MFLCIPEEDIFIRQQFILFRSVSITCGLVCAFLATKLVFTVPDAGLIPLMIYGLSAVILTNFYLLQNLRNIRSSYAILLTATFALLHFVAYRCGGIRCSANFFFPVIILFAYMLLGRKGGLIFSIASLLQMGYLYYISEFTSLTSNSFFHENKSLITQDFLVNGIAAFLMAAWVSSFLQSGKSMVVQQLVASKLDLEKKNKELGQQAETLMKSYKELEKFASLASHDLKAPLRAIGSITEYIQHDTQNNFTFETKEGLDTIKSRVIRMDALLNALLKYTKAGRMKRFDTLVNVNVLLAEVALRFKEKNAFIALPRNEVVLYIDYSVLKQVFFHLIENAILFNDKKKAVISIDVVKTDDVCMFHVNDNGPGIEPAYFDKIFVLFQTLHRRDDIETTGSGLAIVKKLIENLGGNIRVESKQGEGSTFIFSIPCRKIDVSKSPYYDDGEEEDSDYKSAAA